MIALMIWLGWWLGGVSFALWCWAEEYDEIDMATVVVATVLCTFLGPIVGLTWWPKKWPLWRRKKEPKHDRS